MSGKKVIAVLKACSGIGRPRAKRAKSIRPDVINLEESGDETASLPATFLAHAGTPHSGGAAAAAAAAAPGDGISQPIVLSDGEDDTQNVSGPAEQAEEDIPVYPPDAVSPLVHMGEDKLRELAVEMGEAYAAPIAPLPVPHWIWPMYHFGFSVKRVAGSRKWKVRGINQFYGVPRLNGDNVLSNLTADILKEPEFSLSLIKYQSCLKLFWGLATTRSNGSRVPMRCTADRLSGAINHIPLSLENVLLEEAGYRSGNQYHEEISKEVKNVAAFVNTVLRKVEKKYPGESFARENVEAVLRKICVTWDDPERPIWTTEDEE